MDVDEGDAGAGEAAEGPAQQRQRLLRRPPDGDVEQRVGVGVVAAQDSAAPAAVEEPVGGGAGRRRRAQDLHSRPVDGRINLSLCLRSLSLCYKVSSLRPYTAAAAKTRSQRRRVACTGTEPTHTKKLTEIVRKSASAQLGQMKNGG